MPKDLDKKIQEWMDAQEKSTLVCFQCKKEPDHVYFPADFSWDPVLICRKCRNHFDKAVQFAREELDGSLH